MSKVIGYSVDDCANCISVKQDAEDAEVFMEWHTLEGNNIPEIVRSMTADMTMSNDSDGALELPIIVINGQAAVDLFCQVWMTIPPEEREAACKDGVCSIAGPKGQTWDFDAEEEE